MNDFFHIQAPTLMKIIGGMLKIKHVKQFIIIGVSICILLWLFRVLAFTTLLIIIASCIVATLLLSFLEKLCRKHNSPEDNEPLFDTETEKPWFGSTQIRYDLRAYSKDDSYDNSGICGICLERLRDGSEVATLQCCHSFHPSCIEKWAKVQDSCPMCKTSFI